MSKLCGVCEYFKHLYLGILLSVSTNFQNADLSVRVCFLGNPVLYIEKIMFKKLTLEFSTVGKW